MAKVLLKNHPVHCFVRKYYSMSIKPSHSARIDDKPLELSEVTEPKVNINEPPERKPENGFEPEWATSVELERVYSALLGMNCM